MNRGRRQSQKRQLKTFRSNMPGNGDLDENGYVILDFTEHEPDNTQSAPFLPQRRPPVPDTFRPVQRPPVRDTFRPVPRPPVPDTSPAQDLSFILAKYKDVRERQQLTDLNLSEAAVAAEAAAAEVVEEEEDKEIAALKRLAQKLEKKQAKLAKKQAEQLAKGKEGQTGIAVAISDTGQKNRAAKTLIDGLSQASAEQVAARVNRGVDRGVDISKLPNKGKNRATPTKSRPRKDDRDADGFDPNETKQALAESKRQQQHNRAAPDEYGGAGPALAGPAAAGNYVDDEYEMFENYNEENEANLLAHFKNQQEEEERIKLQEKREQEHKEYLGPPPTPAIMAAEVLALSIAHDIGEPLWSLESDKFQYFRYRIMEWPEMSLFAGDFSSLDFSKKCGFALKFSNDIVATDYKYTPGKGARNEGSTAEVVELIPTFVRARGDEAEAADKPRMMFKNFEANITKIKTELETAKDPERLKRLRNKLDSIKHSRLKEMRLIDGYSDHVQKFMIPAKIVPVMKNAVGVGKAILMYRGVPLNIALVMQTLFGSVNEPFDRKLAKFHEIYACVEKMQNELIENGFLYTDLKTQNMLVVPMPHPAKARLVFADYGGLAMINESNDPDPAVREADNQMVSTFYMPENNYSAVSITRACANIMDPGDPTRRLDPRDPQARRWVAERYKRFVDACFLVQMIYNNSKYYKRLFVHPPNQSDPQQAISGAAADLQAIRDEMRELNVHIFRTPVEDAKYHNFFENIYRRLDPNPHKRVDCPDDWHPIQGPIDEKKAEEQEAENARAVQMQNDEPTVAAHTEQQAENFRKAALRSEKEAAEEWNMYLKSFQAWLETVDREKLDKNIGDISHWKK
jgi:hypothetical protein